MPQLEEMDSDAAFAWLEGLAAKQGADELGLLLNPDERTETPPEWVQASIENQQTEELEAEAGEVGTIPEITPDETVDVDSLPAEQEEPSEPTLPDSMETEEPLPDWLQEVEPTIEAEEAGDEPLPDWLQEAGESLETESAEPQAASQAVDDLPDWLKAMQLEEAETEQVEAEKTEEVPDWLQTSEVEPETGSIDAESQQDWLADLEEPTIEGDTKPTRVVAEEQETATLPHEDATEYVPSDEEELETQVEAAAETAAELETELDADDSFAWLESLAAKQGVDEGMLLTPEERLETPPEWIKTALDKQFGELETEETTESTVISEEEAVTEEPEQPGQAEHIEAPESIDTAPELPDWLSDMEAESSPDETDVVIETIAESPASDETDEAIPDLPSWLAEPVEQETPAWTPPEPEKQKLDLNKASLVELERLPGIGFIVAQKIITYRDQNGPFSNPIDLQQIPGFSSAMLQEIEDLIVVEAPEQPALSQPVQADSAPELAEARQEMTAGELEQALEKYGDMILQKQSLDEVIHDLHQILLQHENEAAVWQTLGDAQMRANYVQEALESYTRAEQLFR